MHLTPPGLTLTHRYIALSMTHGIVCTLMVSNLERILHQPRHQALTGKPVRRITQGRCAWVLRELVKMFKVRHTQRPLQGRTPSPARDLALCEAETAGMEGPRSEKGPQKQGNLVGNAELENLRVRVLESCSSASGFPRIPTINGRTLSANGRLLSQRVRLP